MKFIFHISLPMQLFSVTLQLIFLLHKSRKLARWVWFPTQNEWHMLTLSTLFDDNKWIWKIKLAFSSHKKIFFFFSPPSFFFCWFFFVFLTTKSSTSAVPSSGESLTAFSVGIHDEFPVVSQKFTQWWERARMQRTCDGYEIAAWRILPLKWLLKEQFLKCVFHQTKTAMFTTESSPCIQAFYAIRCLDFTSIFQICGKIAHISDPKEGHFVLIYLTCCRTGKEQCTR